MRAIVTVVGPDRVGIIGEICSLLASLQVNIADISQTVMQGYFTMMMLVDLGGCTQGFEPVREALDAKAIAMGLSIRIQREDIFHAMHRI